MKHRNPFLVLVFSLITLGIYDLYWLHSTSKVMNSRNTLRKVPSIWLLLSPIVFFILAIVLAILLATSSSGAASETMLLVPLLYVVGIIAAIAISFYWFWQYSKAVNEYTQGRMNFPMTFLLLWVLHLIGVVFIQDAFNDHEGQAAAAAPNPAAPMTPPNGMGMMPQQPQYAPTPPNVPPTTVPPAPQPLAPAPMTPAPAVTFNPQSAPTPPEPLNPPQN